MLIEHDPDMARRAMELARDPEEGPIFAALLGDPHDEEARRRYADWLLDRDDPRGALLSLAMDMATADHHDAGQRERLTALLEEVAVPDPHWWGVVRPPITTLNCGGARDRRPAVRFAMRCPKAWEQLTPTDAPDVRHCGACDQAVVYCDRADTAARRALAGDCIAVPARLTFGKQNTAIVGRPEHPVHTWARELFGEAPSEALTDGPSTS